MRRTIYIQAAEQISIQEPLCEKWMDEPILYDTESFVKAINPSFKEYMAPNEVRRMSNIMKRAIVTTKKVLQETNIEHPDAIITGTSIGCLDYTEKFLDTMVANNEETMSPTHFMQSTHNTVGATLGIYTKTHGYNSTYSHGGVSFELSLLDAWMQLQLREIDNALVTGHDEMVQSYYELLTKSGYVGQRGMTPCGEVAMSMLLNTKKTPDVLCEMCGVNVGCISNSDDAIKQIDRLLTDCGLSRADVGAVVTGVNGKPDNDNMYGNIADKAFPSTPLLHYKHIFGENFTSPALAVYAMAHCLKRGVVPDFMKYENRSYEGEKNIVLLINYSNEADFSVIILKKVSVA